MIILWIATFRLNSLTSFYNLLNLIDLVHFKSEKKTEIFSLFAITRYSVSGAVCSHMWSVIRHNVDADSIGENGEGKKNKEQQIYRMNWNCTFSTNCCSCVDSSLALVQWIHKRSSVCTCTLYSVQCTLLMLSSPTRFVNIVIFSMPTFFAFLF